MPAPLRCPGRICQSPIEMSLTMPIRDVTRGQGYRALPSSPFETLALSSAAELVGVARPRCGGSVTRESDISNRENGDISIGDLQTQFRGSAFMEPKSALFFSVRKVSRLAAPA